MKYATFMIATTLLLASSAFSGVDSDLDGATPGKWTMDFEAAKKVAAEKKIPILLDFSGTDWCGWCKIMESDVFTQPEWADYSKENLMMVLIDFPSDKSLVPEKYVERNNALKTEFGVRGYPTFVILDDDGVTELGRLGSGRGKTPASFQGELQGLFRSRPAELDKYCASIGVEQAKEYRVLLAELDAKKAESKLADKAETEARNKANTAKGNIVNIEKKITAFRVAQFDPENRAKYTELETQRKDAKAKLAEWLKTKPEQTEENSKKYEDLQSVIKELDKQLAEF